MGIKKKILKKKKKGKVSLCVSAAAWEEEVRTGAGRRWVGWQGEGEGVGDGVGRGKQTQPSKSRPGQAGVATALL